MCFFLFNSSICHALLLNYSVWILIRIRIRIFYRIRIRIQIRQKGLDFFRFGFGSATLQKAPIFVCDGSRCKMGLSDLQGFAASQPKTLYTCSSNGLCSVGRHSNHRAENIIEFLLNPPPPS
jgi:hypothetical protein